VESEKESIEAGFGFIDDEILFEEKKSLKKGNYEVFGQTLEGYEIHCGISKKHPLFFESEKASGTHLHGIFENNIFRSGFLKRLNPLYESFEYHAFRESEIKNLAQTVKKNVDIKKILEAIR